jgi:phosphate transport system substrate-binding protein
MRIITSTILMAAVFSTGLSYAAVPDQISGTIKVDGSSTVYPITEAVAEEFGKVQPDIKVTVGISGTGGGFKKFCAGETDVSDASRPIKAAEVELCKKNNVEYVELPIAYDALSVVVNPKNTWVTSLTLKDLKKIWEPEAQGKILSWNQVRPEWPDKPLKLYGPGTDSGTYDYFTEAIMGKEDSSRGDYTSSEDDNTLVQGVASDAGALGFFGLAYYSENKDKLKLVPIDDEKEENGKGPQIANAENVRKGIYQPLSRPLFIYVSKSALAKPEVKEFAGFYIKNALQLTEEVGYVQLPEKVMKLAKNRLDSGKAGSIFSSGPQIGVALEELLSKQS